MARRKMSLVTGLGILLLAGLAARFDGEGADGAPRTVASAQESPNLVYLPVSARGQDFDDLAPAVTSVPATATATDEPTPEPTATPTQVICGLVEDRVHVTSVEVSPAHLRIGSRRSPAAPIYIQPVPDGGGSWVAWADTEGRVHVTRLDDEDQPVGADISLEGDEVRGLVAHERGEGTALLVVKGDHMYLVRLDELGVELWRDDLVGGKSQTVAGSKWVDSWGHEGRLAWSGTEYAAYFGHTQYFGAQGKHQGDLLWLFGVEGEPLSDRRAWDWGCSHSLDVRLAWNGTRYGPACLSDAYPSEGFHFNHRTAKIRAEPSGDGRGYSAANLGGWVPLEDGFMMTFSSPEGRRSSDVGMVHVGNDGAIGEVVWLTDTPGVDEAAPHLARYGEGFIAEWTAGAEHLVSLLDEAGTIIEGPSPVDAGIGARDDMATFPNGDVVWAYAGTDDTALQIARLGWCPSLR